MPCIIKKKRNGNVYYYAAESKRVDGKPRIVWQKYLGTINTILKRCDASSYPDVDETDVFEAGGVAAMLKIAKQINLVGIIDNIVKKRNQGPSVGEYILLAAINRAIDPCSKLKMSTWYRETVLLRLWKYNAKMFSSQHFWNNMDLITEKNIDEIQEQIAKNVIKTYRINTECILYDTTNFFTYIATGNNKNTIAQRGRSKQKRNDLRQVNLALLATKEFNIPLFHKTYEGNFSDRGEFTQRAKEIKRWKEKVMPNQDDTTMVFDKGNISEKAIEQLVASGQHFICGIPKTYVSKLFATPINKFNLVDEMPGTKAYSGEIEIWQIKFKFVLSYSESFFSSELSYLINCLQKCEKKLAELDKRLKKWSNKKQHKNRPTFKTVQKSIEQILSSYPYMKRIMTVRNETRDGIQRILYSLDKKEFDNLTNKELGRTFLITTRQDITDKEVIKTYRDLNVIENAFKNMKNKNCLHWQPVFHWTDQKIKVHGLYCILALLLTSLAYKIIQDEGINISLPCMLEELNKIREVALIYSKRSNKQSKLQISKMSPIQRKISTALEIPNILKG